MSAIKEDHYVQQCAQLREQLERKNEQITQLRNLLHRVKIAAPKDIPLSLHRAIDQQLNDK